MIMRESHFPPSPLALLPSSGDWTHPDSESRFARAKEIAFRSAVITSLFAEYKINGAFLRMEYGPLVSRYICRVSSTEDEQKLEAHQEELSLLFGEYPVFFVPQSGSGPKEVSLEVEDIHPFHLEFLDVYEEHPLSPATVSVGKTISGDNQTLDFLSAPVVYVHGGLDSGKADFIKQIFLELLLQNSAEEITFAGCEGTHPLWDFLPSFPYLFTPIAKTREEKKECLKILQSRFKKGEEDRHLFLFLNGLSGFEKEDLQNLIAEAKQGKLSIVALDDDLRQSVAAWFAGVADIGIYFPSYQDADEVERFLNSPRARFLLAKGDCLFGPRGEGVNAWLRLSTPYLNDNEVKLVVKNFLQPPSPVITTEYALEDSYASLANGLFSLLQWFSSQDGHLFGYSYLPDGAFRFRMDHALSIDKTPIDPSPLELISPWGEEKKKSLYYWVSEMALSERVDLENEGVVYHYEKGHFRGKEPVLGDSKFPLALTLKYLHEGFRDFLPEEDFDELFASMIKWYGDKIVFIKEKV